MSAVGKPDVEPASPNDLKSGLTNAS